MSHFASVPLSSIVSPVERPETPIVGQTYRQVGVRLWGQGAYERESIDGGDTQYKKLNRVELGDIIVNKIWARNGSVSVVWEDTAGCYASGEFPLFVPYPAQLDPRWFFYLTKTPDFWRQCEAKSFGTSGKNRIRPEKFLEIEIPLPPLDEQRRIVAHIDALAEQIAAARGLRHGAVAEAEAFWYSSLRMFREGLVLSKDGLQNLGEITTVTAGGTPSRDNLAYWNGNIPWIKTGELLDGDIYHAQEFISQEGLNNSSAKLFPAETILIALYGQGQTRGRTGRLMFEASTNQACCAVLPHKLLDARYLQYWLRSLYTEMREISHGGAQPNWNSGMIKRIEISLISLDEQRRIVAYLDGLQAEVDALKRLQADTAAELDALLPSLLDQAFRGEL